MFGGFIPYVNNMLDYTNVNSKVIASNIANYNTPSYKAQIVDFENHLEKNLLKTQISTNEPSHISNDFDEFHKKINTATDSHHNKRFDGNNVDQTEEMINLLKNNYTHNLSVSALNKEFELFRTAIGR